MPPVAAHEQYVCPAWRYEIRLGEFIGSVVVVAGIVNEYSCQYWRWHARDRREGVLLGLETGQFDGESVDLLGKTRLGLGSYFEREHDQTE
jgi:hypothetical protein